MINIDCNNMNKNHVCKLDECTCGYTKGKCEDMICKDYVPVKKYLVLCNRHNSVLGDNWGLFWGYRDSEGGYNSDLRTAHRFNESEIAEFNDNSDIPIPVDVLGISEECESEETLNKNIQVLIEKGTLNDLLDLNLRPLYQEKECCPNCGEEL